jgi:hypothetical protein
MKCGEHGKTPSGSIKDVKFLYLLSGFSEPQARLHHGFGVLHAGQILFIFCIN